MPPKRARRTSNRHRDRQVNIPSLPHEVIHHILSYLTSDNQGTLAACCRVSRQFDSIARTLLWRRMRLAPPATAAPGLTSFRASQEDLQEKPLDISHWEEQSRNLVHFLSVKAHDDTWCHFSHPRQLDLPNLKVLHVDAHEHRIWSAGVFHRHLSNNPYCPLLKALRPEVVIIRNIDQQTFETQCRGIPLRTWSEARTLILVSSSFSPYRYQFYYRDPPSGLAKLQKVIWLLDPRAFPRIPVTSLTQPIAPRDHPADIENILLLDLLERFIDVPKRIVNLDPGARYRLYSPVSADLGDDELTSENIFRQNLTHLVENTPTHIRKEDLPRKQGLIDFMSLNEFLEKENWKDWFEEEEMMNWVDIMGKLNGQEEIEG